MRDFKILPLFLVGALAFGLYAAWIGAAPRQVEGAMQIGRGYDGCPCTRTSLYHCEDNPGYTCSLTIPRCMGADAANVCSDGTNGACKGGTRACQSDDRRNQMCSSQET